MALTDTQKRDAARKLAHHIFQKSNTTANLNLDDLAAAIGSIDAAMDTVINDIPVGARTNTIKQLFNANLPEPFKSAATPEQKAMALAMWAMREVGLIG